MSFDFQAVLQETVQKRQYFLYKFNETRFLLHVGAECQEQCSDGKLGKTAFKAVDKLLDECTDAFTAFVFKIINQKTVAMSQSADQTTHAAQKMRK
jgi:hypothetical protein